MFEHIMFEPLRDQINFISEWIRNFSSSVVFEKNIFLIELPKTFNLKIVPLSISIFFLFFESSRNIEACFGILKRFRVVEERRKVAAGTAHVTRPPRIIDTRSTLYFLFTWKLTPRLNRRSILSTSWNTVLIWMRLTWQIT